MRRLSLAIAAALLLSPTWASEPGQPLDCSDFVFLEPGLSCLSLVDDCRAVDPNIGCQWDPDNIFGQNPIAIDNQGGLYRSHGLDLPFGPCNRARYSLQRLGPTGWTDIAQLETRCLDPVNDIRDEGYIGRRIEFDGAGGRFVMEQGGNGSVGGGVERMIAIAGFATTFDILQTFQPAAAALGFRVPYMPEGLPAADHFDTYYGDLSTVGDWSQAQPLQCGYPATPPSVGDYLEVADPLPNPSPGSGRYYVTAVNHMGQRRYGRKASNGQLSGRDPAVLPTCQ